MSAWRGVRGLREKIVDASRSLHDVFRNPGLRRIELAFAGSIVGDWAYAVAVAVYAYDHGGATAVGVLGWLAVATGTLRLAAPKRSLDFGRRVYDKRNAIYVAAGIWIAIGAVLCVFGYLK